MTNRFKFPRSSMVFIYSVLFLVFPGRVLGQTAPVAERDPKAVALASQSLQALAGTTSLVDVTLQASATYIPGPNQQAGPATLLALGNQLSRVALNLTNGTRLEIRNGIAGAWVGQDGAAHAMALHNCWTDGSWFFPALSLQAALQNPQMGLVFVGLESKLGIPVAHLQIYKTLPLQPKMTPVIQRLSATDIYLAISTNLPLALDFYVHAQNDAGVSIPVEIQYSNYASAGGVVAAYHIQKYQGGSLTLDLVVGGVAVNSGLNSSIFALPPT